MTTQAPLPVEQPIPDPRLARALGLSQSGRPEEAEGLYRDLCGTPPRDAAGLMLLAETARILGRPADVAAWAEAAVRAKPDAAEGWSALALALVAIGRVDAGEAAAEQALRHAEGGVAAVQALRALALARLRRNRLAEAAEACGEALRLADGIPQHQDQTLCQARAEAQGTLALVRMLEGRLEDADALFRQALVHRPLLPEVLGNHASLLARLGRDDEALEQAEQAVALRPRLVGTLHLIGSLHHRTGRHEVAIAAFHRLLAVDPSHFEARLRLSDSLRIAGHWEEAATVCRDGLARASGDNGGNGSGSAGTVGLLANLGAALQAGGDAAGALEAYREALSLAPDLPEVHNNLARLHQEAGDADAAIEELRRATAADQPAPLPLRRTLLSLLIRANRSTEAEAEAFAIARGAPEDAELCFGIATLFLQGGWHDHAVPYARKAIRLAPNTPRYWIAFVDTLRDLPLTKADPGLRTDLLAAIGRPEVEAAGLARAIAGVLLASPALQRLTALPEEDGAALNDASRMLLADGSLAGLAEDALLLAHLRAAPVTEPLLERGLTRLRRVLLLALTGPGLPDRSAWPILCAALAEQCFLNEYAFAETDGEFQALVVLVRAAEAALGGGEPPPAVLVALLGAYRPLRHWEQAASLMALSWPEEIVRLLDRQIAEPEAEARIAAELPVLTPIRNPVSVGVRAQYEENPYPRWLDTGRLPEPVPLSRFLHALFPHAALPASPAWETPSWEAPKLLVAGCGTGREAIWSASTLKGAQVLAVDLSRRSLAYAARQSRRLGLAIEFAQADLLELGALGHRFDVIHSVGVLHHMEDPMAGLRVLRGLMSPQGVMEVGFYSAIARRPVLAARQFIAERGHPSTVDGIRRLRQEILALPPDHPVRAVVHSPDFYGTSSCRDLLMHVQESHVTLPWLANALKTLNLEFLGFRLADPAVAALYRRRFPEDPAMTSFARWDLLETEHPTIFGGMYQAWVRARG